MQSVQPKAPALPPVRKDVSATQEPVWFAMVALIVGALPFAFAPNIVTYPRVAALALATLAVASLLLLIPPFSRGSATARHSTHVLLLLAFATIMAMATGKARSPLLVLYLLPLAVTGWAFAGRASVIVCGIAVASLGGFLAAATEGTAPFAREFIVLLFSMLLPAVAVAFALAHAVEMSRTTEQRLITLAGTDPLTGLLTAKAFEDALRQQHGRAQRRGQPYSILLIEVNDLTSINETLGHAAGNELLLVVAQAIGRSVRQADLTARLAGEQFAVMLGETDAPRAAAIAQRMRNHVYQGTISVGKRLLRASVSIGSAQFPEDDLHPKELMILASQRLQAQRALHAEAATA